MDDIKEILRFVRESFDSNGFIPLHQPYFGGNEKKYLLETIDSTFVSSVGPFVNQFEDTLADITGAAKAVAVVNGTAGLQVALKLVGVREGDEVVTQALTFVATSNAIQYNGAKPVYIDVDLDTMGLSPVALDNFLKEHGEIREDGCYNRTTGNRISACLPMHTFGFPVHLDELVEVCSRWMIPIVEDAAESLGSYYQGKHTGSIGDVGVFSLNGNKTITSGGGGAIVTRDFDLAERAKYLTTTAKRPHEFEFYHDETGFNFRMPNLNAALACAQLEKLEYILANKRELAHLYIDFFHSRGIKFRTELPNTRANYWLMCVELEDRKERDIFLRETNDSKIMTRPIWQLMFKLPMYSTCQRDDQKNALYLEDRIVNIPSSVRKENVK